MSDHTDDIVSKIVEANALESSGQTAQAIALYREILELDPGGNYGDVAQQALDNLQVNVDVQQATEEQSHRKESASLWSKPSIKAKTSLILTGIALISSIGISTVAYMLADKTIRQQTNRAEQAKSYEMTNQLALFMHDRKADLEAMSNIAVLADPELRANSTPQQQQNVLAQYLKAYRNIYNSIAVYDINGDHWVNDTGKSC